jgi:tRNA (Thr-GGU) A37 N-methylase
MGKRTQTVRRIRVKNTKIPKKKIYFVGVNLHELLFPPNRLRKQSLENQIDAQILVSFHITESFKLSKGLLILAQHLHVLCWRRRIRRRRTTTRRRRRRRRRGVFSASAACIF